MAVNVARVLDRADAQLQRLEAAELARLREVVNRAYRALEEEVRRRWPLALSDASGQSRTFAEARARALLAQLEPFMRALEWGSPSTGVPGIMRDIIQLGHQHGLDTAGELLSAFQAAGVDGLATATARIDFRAVEAALSNSRARLARYAQETISQIEQAVVDGIVRGEGNARVARRIRDALRGDGRSPSTGLYARARTIARTELATAKTLATEQRYREANVPMVQWFATLDERTCRYCAARHGNAYRLGDATVPAHPNCRCYLAPFRPEWLELDLIDKEWWRESKAEIRELVPDPIHTSTPFERANNRPPPTIAWTP